MNRFGIYMENELVRQPMRETRLKDIFGHEQSLRESCWITRPYEEPPRRACPRR
jgi:hypothetical protein